MIALWTLHTHAIDAAEATPREAATFLKEEVDAEDVAEVVAEQLRRLAGIDRAVEVEEVPVR